MVVGALPPNQSPPPVGQPAQQGNDKLPSPLARLVVAVGSPVAVAGTLMFYFGWVRTRTQARELGFDADVLGFSTTDYILKSINVLFPLVAVVLVAAVVVHASYTRVLPHVLSRPRARHLLLRTARVAPYATLLAVAAGLVLAAFPSTAFAAVPGALTVGILVALWGRHIRRDVEGHDPWTRTGSVLGLLLLVVVLFWDTERVAHVSGEAFAYDIASDPQQFAQIAVFSHDDLHLEAAGVSCGVAAPLASAFPYECTGLRLMEKTTARYVLINEVWYQGRGRVVVLADSDQVRVEFVDAY